ncbi:hypothetical protein ACFL28_01980 [Candidatus Omnitrophota bacterium]
MNNKAFLLFEVMVSIVVITIGFFFIVNSYVSSKNSLQRSTELFKTTLLLESKMWEIEQKGELEEGIKSGDFRWDERYAWQIETARMEEAELNLVRLSVFQKKDPRLTEYSIVTCLKDKIE